MWQEDTSTIYVDRLWYTVPHKGLYIGYASIFLIGVDGNPDSEVQIQLHITAHYNGTSMSGSGLLRLDGDKLVHIGGVPPTDIYLDRYKIRNEKQIVIDTKRVINKWLSGT